jgi:hypothetical protein
MRIDEIQGSAGIRPLKYPLGEVPHATIETNRTCNIRCRSCYNLDHSWIKTSAQVLAEIDLALEKRNLQAMSILGGEPTLHPDLRKIIAHIKRRGLFCQLLTNGIALLGDEGEGFLDGLIASGLDRILLHVDSGQSHVHGDVAAVRQALFSRCEKKRLPFFLSLTIRNEDQGTLPALLREYCSYRYFDGVLAVLARDPRPPRVQKAELSAEYAGLAGALNLQPAAYVPSNRGDADVRWLIYSYFINARTRRTLCVSPGSDRLFRRLFRFFCGRELFTRTWKPGFVRCLFLLAGLAEGLKSPARIRDALGVLRSSSLGRDVRFHFLAIQTPPEVNPQTEEYLLCYHCPDATVRNGRLMPVCLADELSSFDGPTRPERESGPWGPVVAEHLAEG